jgi:outer membrane protein assembly factor BamB
MTSTVRRTFGEQPNMMPQLKRNNFKKTIFAVHSLLSQKRGSILVYIIVVMLIFAVLGAAMVSLFSTSISSSATANESRRAFYLAEAGLRYGLSELRQQGFSTLNIATLNTTEYKMPPSGSFDITVFGAWFRSPSVQTVNSGPLTVELVKGKIPTGFFARLTDAVPDLYLVLGKLGPSPVEPKPAANEVAKVRGFTPGSDTSFQFDLSGGLFVGPKDWICMAVQPAADRTFIPSGDSNAYIDLMQSAAKIFPKTDRAFQFDNRVYFYKSAKEETGYFRLSNITPEPSGSLTNPVTLSAATDYILLAPNNFFVTSKGTSGNVDFGGDMDHAASLASRNLEDLHQPDIEKPTYAQMTHIESVAGYTGDPSQPARDYLQIGPTAGMGAMWYNQNLTLGGSTNYCTSTPDINSRVGCFFRSGMRAYFTLEYSGTGDGLIFALMNGSLNDSTSVGGDGAQSELLGYAGDGRNADGSYIGGSRHGLDPPKIGLEFDAKRNWSSSFEAKPVDFCDGSLKANTRNDPDVQGAGSKDYVQYAYWGAASLTASCRSNNPSYDDNRHNPGATPTGDWFQPLSGVVNTSPAVSEDGRTIYVATNALDINGKPTAGRLYTIDLDAQGYVSSVWNWPASNGVTSPVVDRSLDPTRKGTVYVGTGNSLYAFRPDRSIKFSKTLHASTRASKPVIGPNGNIYIAASDDAATGYLYAIRPDGSLDPDWTTNPRAIPRFFTDPVLTPDGSLIIAATDASRIYALRASTGSFDPSWTPSGAFITASARNTPGVGPGATSKGTVYVTTSDRRVYALSGENGSTLLTSPVIATEGLATQPVVAGGAVYVGSYDDHLYALNTSNLGLRWSYYAAGNVQSAPAVDSNGTLYFGSDIRNISTDNRNIYALYSDGTEKWRYTSGGDVRGTPAVMPDGSVYIGSFDYNLYAINQFALPKSLKDKFITYDSGAVGGVPVAVDLADEWLNSRGAPGSRRIPWAVRLEVYRSTITNTSEPLGYYSYNLRAWLRQCKEVDCRDEIGSLYDDTRLRYEPALRPPQMEQTINLSPDNPFTGVNGDHNRFARFLFGFTSQTASGDDQRADIRSLKLSFVRSTDLTVTCDPNWPEGTTCP